MTPLGKIVAGMALVVLDFRLDGIDLIPDALGWTVVLAGLLALAGRSAGFAVAAVAAACGVVLGIPQLVAEPGQVVTSLETIVHGVVVFGTLTGIREVVEDPRTRNTANRIRWIDLSLTLSVLIATTLIAPTTVTGSGGPLVVLFVVAVLAVFLWFFVFLWTNRHDPALGSGSYPVVTGA